MSESTYNPYNGNEENDIQRLRNLISFVWKLRYWMVLSAAVMLCVTFVCLKLTTPVYECTTQVMLSNERAGTSEISMLTTLTGVKQSSMIDNEIFILRSPTLMSHVVEDLGLNTRYREKKYLGLRTHEFYKDSPFTMTIEKDPLYPEEMHPSSVSVKFVQEDEQGFTIKKILVKGKPIKDYTLDKKLKHLYGVPVAFNGFSVTICRTGEMKDGARFTASWSSPYATACSIMKRLEAKVEPAVLSKVSKTDVITVYLKDSKPARAEDILDCLIRKYNEEYRAYKNETAKRSIEFIDQRLQDISKELGDVESSYRKYQSSRTIINVDAQSKLTLSSDMEYEKGLTEIRLQQRILTMVKDDLKKMGDAYKVLPSNIGLSDANLNSVITSYNTLVAERNRLVANSSENNPRVRSLGQQLEDGRNSIILSIDNLEKIYSIREKEIDETLQRSKAKMSEIPMQQFDLTQIERKQQIIEPLYLLLQQRREETQISMYTVADNARVIEPAHTAPIPVSPKSTKILAIMLLLSLCVPPCTVLLLGLLRTTVSTKEDITKAIPDAIVLGNLPQSEDYGILTSSGGRDIKSESFRVLRSNLQFLHGNVIQVTSSIPGEGKTYTAANLAACISHVGKKVILVGLDLRKPKLAEMFPLDSIDYSSSVVSYLVGDFDDPQKTVFHSKDVAGLDIACSSVLPPNPTELLSTERLETLIQWYREHYDYVILDSAPMMPVSDSFIINKHVDITLYVVRSGFTKLGMLSDIDQLIRQNGVASPKFVLNCIDFESKGMKYGYGSKYGYSYGYGYGYDTDSKGRGTHRRSKKA